jgi:hypothetical protein
MERHDKIYNGYRIIAAEIKGNPVAQIYLGKDRVGGMRFEGEPIEGVSAEARAWIDGRLKADREAQRAANIATPERYAEFFRLEKLGEHERAMLLAHAKDRVLTAGALARAAGWDSFSSANVHYGYLGRKAAAFLGLELPRRRDGTPVYTMALAEDAGEGGDPDNSNFQWAVHPEVVEGMFRAGLLNELPNWMSHHEAGRPA